MGSLAMKETNRLLKLLKELTKQEASHKVYSQATYYPEYVKVYIPHQPYEKLIPFMEGRKVLTLSPVSNKASTEDNYERSIRRTKKLISDYVECNSFELFVTFTFSPHKTKDRADADAVKRQMSTWLKNQNVRLNKFKYLIVPEFHSDGKSLHFHALFQGYTGTLIDSGKTYNGRKIYNLKGYTLGLNTAATIDSKGPLSSYVKKYITKDMPQFHGKHRFWASKGLDRPRTEDNPPDWYRHRTPLRTYENEYGTVLYFPREMKGGDEE